MVLLVVLGLVWAVYFIPPWVRNRNHRHPHGSINSFSTTLSTLSALDRTAARASGRPTASALPGAPRPVGGLTRAEARRRRKEILFTLAGAAGISLVLAVALGGIAVWLHLLIDVVLVTYIALLIRAQKLASEQEAKVRFMPTPGQPEPALLLRRSAAN